MESVRQLGGIKTEVSADGSGNSSGMQKKLLIGDERAQTLYKKFHVIMPSFGSNSNDQIDASLLF